MTAAATRTVMVVVVVPSNNCIFSRTRTCSVRRQPRRGDVTRTAFHAMLPGVYYRWQTLL